MDPRLALGERFLVLAPTGRDGPLTCRLLERGSLAAQLCATMEELCGEVDRGAAGVLVAEEVLLPEAARRLADLVARQEPWSDLPVLLFTGQGATIQACRPTVGQLAPFGNVTLLDRPIRAITMISAARAALRARRRQYEGREEMARRSEAVRARDQFLAMLGHELRNPIHTTLLAIEIMERGEGAPDRQLQILRRQATNLGRLVDDLLEVARVTTGKVVLQRRRLDVNVVAARVAEAMDAVVALHGLDLAVRRSRSPAIVDGDPVRLEQVLGNLLANAIKYTPAGGHVDLAVSTDSPGEVAVAVCDTGVGIEPEMLPRVFDLFAQAESTLDRARGGLGIGLALVRSLVEMHGGRVEASSPGRGGGSRFVVRLPRVEAVDAPAAEVPVAASGAVSPGRHVLVVEDQHEACELLRQTLESMGHRVDVAEDGIAAVELAVRRRPEVLLVDIGLPGLDGYAVARQVRSSLGDEPLLIAVTGYGQPEDRRRSLQAGFDVHCTKPLDLGLLRDLLASRKRRSGEPV